MAQAHAKRGHRTGRKGPRGPKKTYQASRLRDSDSEDEPQLQVDAENADLIEDVASDPSSENESEPRKNAYAALLETLGQVMPEEAPRRKRRKLNGTGRFALDTDLVQEKETERQDHGNLDGSVADALQEPDPSAVDEDEDEDEEAESGDEVEAEAKGDLFDLHFSAPDQQNLSRRLGELNAKRWKTHWFTRSSGRWTVAEPGESSDRSREYAQEFPDISSFPMKKRISETADKVLESLADIHEGFASVTFQYRDVLFGGRTAASSSVLRNITCVHALNHIFKTRDKVIKNSARIAKAGADSVLEYRDQGFTRPKVLVLLPTRKSCVNYINAIVAISHPEQQENRKRFEDSYVADEEMAIERPDDYRELFAGNSDDMFRIGVKFTRKTVKFFSQFYNSDLIIASPLGLRQAISGKKSDSDFLSSIEILILDQTDALLMQNWEHVTHVLSHLNLQPKEAHGCDFSRVRPWYLDGHAKHLRQTIILSAYLAPHVLSLLSTHCLNIAGRAIYSPRYAGAILTPQSQGLKQTFLRYPSPTLSADPDARFKYFTSALLPSLTKAAKRPDGSGLGLLVYIPDSLDFPRVRNHFSFHSSLTHISFCSISENASPASKEVRRARSHFAAGRHGVMLYTERAHHFFRYRIKGVKRIVFYGAPSNPIFWEEVTALIGETDGDVRAVFSQWDRLALERVVGSERVSKMLREKRGDVFEFV